ncbi:MAG: hypothetical protein K0U72_00870 [Gammaproteobacteria bacterium]|nr:hypothetical protein [Gammaproteobacteria bacterium]
MNTNLAKAALAAVLLATSGAANADYGVGVKAGTLGLGVEGRWSPIDWLDVRVGANAYDFEDSGSQAGINYNATFALDSYYATGNFRFPLSPFRVTAGIFSNGNELQMVSADTGGANLNIGGVPFTAADIGTLRSVTSFSDTAPYFGMGFDFEVFDKVGLNLDFGVLWQGEPIVTLEADGNAAGQQVFIDALEAERLEIEDEVSDYKAWPVVSLGFVYNF